MGTALAALIANQPILEGKHWAFALNPSQITRVDSNGTLMSLLTRTADLYASYGLALPTGDAAIAKRSPMRSQANSAKGQPSQRLRGPQNSSELDSEAAYNETLCVIALPYLWPKTSLSSLPKALPR